MSSEDEAFVEYVAARRDHLFRAAVLLCGDRHQAEDLVQTTLTKLYLGWRRVSRADIVDAYVRRMLVNAHLDETRRPWRRERPEADPPERSTSGVEGPDDALWNALAALPPKQRRVVVLRHYWGLSVAETAHDLRISEGTVKSQTSAALAALRRALRPAPTTCGGSR
ncbi:SigE family RNA polymerase sigma factor [Nocardioides insulae]|uniref:SigE family RNA polymerase sigma factor n=1 Tax=Nocardioides insulae TaxID=394734 RepID=UPI0003FFDBA8|nr:SigE family RNA polymerase sigma factor [Nocardioides insulae]